MGQPPGNTTNNGAYVYDAENRLASVAVPATSYVYDGDGKRLIKCAGTYPSCSSGTLYWTGTGSDALAESDLSGNLSAEYIFFNGMRVVRKDLPSGAIHDYFPDALGTTRIVANPLSPSSVCVQESDYYPYGGEIPISNCGDTNHYKFTGKERDVESGLDEFGARYYASSQGRFVIPDWAEKPTTVPYASVECVRAIGTHPSKNEGWGSLIAGRDGKIEGCASPRVRTHLSVTNTDVNKARTRIVSVGVGVVLMLASIVIESEFPRKEREVQITVWTLVVVTMAILINHVHVRERWFWQGFLLGSLLHIVALYGSRDAMPFPSLLVPFLAGLLEATVWQVIFRRLSAK